MIKYVITGRVASGKRELAERLSRDAGIDAGMKVLRPRTPDGEGLEIATDRFHVMPPEEYDAMPEKLFERRVDGARCCTTKADLEAADIIIADPDDLNVLFDMFQTTAFNIIYVQVPEEARTYAMDMESKQRAEVYHRNHVEERAYLNGLAAKESTKFNCFEFDLKSRPDGFVPNCTQTVFTRTNMRPESMDGAAKQILEQVKYQRNCTKLVKILLADGVVERREFPPEISTTHPLRSSTMSILDGIDIFTDLVMADANLTRATFMSLLASDWLDRLPVPDIPDEIQANIRRLAAENHTGPAPNDQNGNSNEPETGLHANDG